MPKEMERYGTVKVISGKFKGRIGYYDDDDSIFPENYEWNEEDDDDEDEDELDCAALLSLPHPAKTSPITHNDATNTNTFLNFSINFSSSLKFCLENDMIHQVPPVKSC